MKTFTHNEVPHALMLIFSKLENLEKFLQEEKSSENIPALDELLTVQEAAEFLHLSVSTVYGLVQRSEIPVNKLKKRLYFSKPELIIWIKTGRKKTTSEIEADTNEFLGNKKKKI